MLLHFLYTLHKNVKQVQKQLKKQDNLAILTKEKQDLRLRLLKK